MMMLSRDEWYRRKFAKELKEVKKISSHSEAWANIEIDDSEYYASFFKQGQSVATASKQQKFGSCLAINLQAVQSMARRQPRRLRYWHLDMHAGCGYNESVGIPGSPIVFCD